MQFLAKKADSYNISWSVKCLPSILEHTHTPQPSLPSSFTLFVAPSHLVDSHMSIAVSVSKCNWYFSQYTKSQNLVSYPVRSSLTQKQQTISLRWVRPERSKGGGQRALWLFQRSGVWKRKRLCSFRTVSQRSKQHWTNITGGGLAKFLSKMTEINTIQFSSSAEIYDLVLCRD